MKSNKKLLRKLGIIFFLAGILTGMIMFILMNWAYFEAYFFFGYTFPADKPLTTLRCPLLMTTADTSEVTIRLTNDTNQDLAPLIRTEISYFGAARSESIHYPLAAGETRKLAWTVSSEDMVFGHLVMARVFVYNVFTLPSRTNTCGTVMVNLPGLSGNQLFIVVLTFILVCILAGWSMWLAGSRPIQTDGLVATRAMAFFTIAVVLGLIAGIIGWWVAGLICTVVCLLLIVVVSTYYIQIA